MSLLNKKPDAPAENPMQDNVLQAAEQKIESQLTPETQAAYMRIVTAGMKIALAKGPNGIMAGIAHSQNPLQDCAKGAIGLVGMMFKQSRGTMPVKALIPAATTLMLKALDFADRTGVVKVGTPELVQATHIFANLMLKEFGVTGQMLKTAAGKIHQIANDPASMTKIHLAAGTMKDPRAPVPTPMPEASAPQVADEEGGKDGTD